MKTNRRSAIAFAGVGIAISGISLGQQGAPAQQSTGNKGPVVWLDMDQKELDNAYTQSVYAANLGQVAGRYATNSEFTRQRIGEPRRFSYGLTQIEGLDVFPAGRTGAPTLVFVHGGAWRNALAKNYAFPAEVFVRAGANYVVLDFINVDDASGSLTPMADQVRRAVAWLYRNARSFGGDANRLFLAGHSSGAHLAGVALTTDWQKEFNLPPDVVKGALCCSGMYDLRPIRLSIRSSYVKFTDEMEQSLSPQRHLERLGCPITLAYGTAETPEFQRQTRDFAAAAKAAGKPTQLLIGQGYNHFEILETLANPYGLLGRAALQLMNLEKTVP